MATRPQRSYWNGCSTGGRQALKEAQMFPGRFRRHHRRRAGESDRDGAVDRARAAEGSGQPHPAGEVSADPPGGAGGLRCGGRTEGRPDRRPDPLQVRSRRAAVQGRRSGRIVSRRRRSRPRARYTGPAKIRAPGKELFGTLAPGSELGWARHGRRPGAVRAILDQAKYVVFKDAELGLAHVRFRQG